MRKVFLTKSFLQKSSILFALFILTSCKSQIQFDKVISGKIIAKELPFVYNEESIIRINNNRIFIVKSENYDGGYNLIDANISKPEGAVNYSRKELEIDKLFTEYNKITLDRNNTRREGNFVFDNNEKYKIAYKTRDTLLCMKEENVLLFVENQSNK